MQACMICCAWLTVMSDASALPSSNLGVYQQVPVKWRDGQAQVHLQAPLADRNYLLIVGSTKVDENPSTIEVAREQVDDARAIELHRPQRDLHWSRLVYAQQLAMRTRRQTLGEHAFTSAAKFAETKRFFIFTGETDFYDEANYQEVVGRLRAVGDKCLVYVDEADTDDVDEQQISFIVSTFDHEVFPVASQMFGSHRDVDRNGKFTIFISHWLSRLSNGKVSLGGFVRGGDFHRDLAAPYGNQCDMLYLNSNVKPGGHLRTLLAHEYTHAVTFSEHVFVRYLPSEPPDDDESWLSEALSHLAENQINTGWSNLDYRISTYLSAPHRYRLVVPDYYSAGLWRCHGSRGSTYLFLRWCVDRFGDELLKDLSKSNLAGRANIEAATQTPFSELFRQWSVDLCLNGVEPVDPDAVTPTVDLYGPLERRVLTGIRAVRLEQGVATHELAGTAFKPLKLKVKQGTVSRITVKADPETEPQLTIVRLPDSLPSASLTATRVNRRHLQLELHHESGSPVTWETLTWERESLPHTKTNVDFKSAEVSTMTDHFATATTTAGSRISSNDVDVSADYGGTIVFKLLGRDDLNRNVAAWGTCTLD